MFLKSIKSQLTLITIFFILFVVIVLFQLSYSYKLSYDEVVSLIENHEVITKYQLLQEKEKNILNDLHGFIDSKVLPTTEMDELDKQIDVWIKELKDWEGVLRTWEETSPIRNNDMVFDNTFLDVKKRQAQAYKKALELCRSKELGKANKILRIEEDFNPPVEKTILAILGGIQAQMKDDLKLIKRFSFMIAFAILVALLVIVIISASSLQFFNKALKSLKKAARRISMGEFDVLVKVKRPDELADLAVAFNEMQAAIEARDNKITEDREEIRKLNEILEKKVDDSSKKIVIQNEALKRKNSELEQILHAASHDLRTPLISIQGFSDELQICCQMIETELAKEEMNKGKIVAVFDEDIKMALNYIGNGVKRMEMLLEGLLRISRMGRDSLKITPIDMNQLAESVVNTLSIQIEQADAEIKVGELHPCNGDESIIEQIMTNLLTNPLKYRSPERKCLIEVSSEKLENSVKYTVKDNGIGISEENVGKVFKAFYRVDEETVQGDGVGLAVVSRALDLHNGKVNVSSKLGEGSTFTFELPDDPTELIED
jgi:signal transduction histidine kinase